MRKNLCEKIAYMWREAENQYLDSDFQNANMKTKVKKYAEKYNLTEEESKKVYAIAYSMGI